MITKIAAPQNPYINIHGSFSMPTNFHAIDAFVENHNGHVFSSPYLEGFNVFVSIAVLCLEYSVYYGNWSQNTPYYAMDDSSCLLHIHSRIIQHYAKMFAGKCIVNKDNFTFPQTSQMLNITKSVYEKETLQSSPQRIINLKDGKTTANITCVFVTDYFSKYENLFLVEYKQFDIMVKDTIITDDGNQYSFEFYVLFYLGEEYIDKYK